MLVPRNHHHLQMSTCLSGSGGGRPAYAFELEILKSPTSSSSSSSSSSAAASPCSVATRKARTPRKRPNQTYNEAAALLSASYPNLFDSPKGLPSSAALPFLLLRRDDLLFSPPPPPFSPRLPHRPRSSDCSAPPPPPPDPDSDFDAESLLDDDDDAAAGRGIDTIMGDLVHSAAGPPPLPLGLGLGLGRVAALRRDYFGGEAANWWCFPAVDMLQLSPRFTPPPPAKQKKAKPASSPERGGGLSLKLNYDGVLRAWSGKGSPFSEDQGVGGGRYDDVSARAAEIELFPPEEGGGGGVREASVLRYKEKRRTRLFSKKIIRYQVRKVNADRRPRMKGRFVRRLNSKHE